MIEPLRLSFVVECPAGHAFAVWTQKASSWWPAAHTATGEDQLEVIFEPRVGGRVFERTVTGVEVDWGKVTAWDPPLEISYSWHIATDEASATDVDVKFVDLGDSTTRIDIVHRGWERLGQRGPSWRDVNLGGWDGVLPHFKAACASGLSQR